MKNTKNALTKYYQACGYGERSELLALGAIEELKAISENGADEGEHLDTFDVVYLLEESILGFQNEDCSIEAMSELQKALDEYSDEWREPTDEEKEGYQEMLLGDECDRF